MLSPLAKAAILGLTLCMVLLAVALLLAVVSSGADPFPVALAVAGLAVVGLAAGKVSLWLWRGPPAKKDK